MTGDELILVRLIESMQDTSHKYKILEMLQIINMNLEASIAFLNQLELIKFSTH